MSPRSATPAAHQAGTMIRGKLIAKPPTLLADIPEARWGSSLQVTQTDPAEQVGRIKAKRIKEISFH